MIQHTTERFELTEKEIREAIYDYSVRKFRNSGISAFFTPENIDLGEGYPRLVLVLEVRKNKELE
jgi:hypothetical protein